MCTEFVEAPPEFDLNTCSVEFTYEYYLLDWCGPYVQDGHCCFDLRVEYYECCGRPFLVDAVPRLAHTVRREDWQSTVDPRLDHLDALTRDALARAWADDAAAEHASIAAFARFTLQLLVLGAPADLLVEAQAALADEVEHARLCYALASAYAGTPLGPGGLSVDGALTAPVDLTAAALATFYEGCVGETFAAVEAATAAAHARDPAVAAILQHIADDECRHAVLAWRFLAWTLARGGSALHHALSAAVARLTPDADPQWQSTPSDDTLVSHGRLSPAARRAERHATLCCFSSAGMGHAPAW